MYAASTAVTKEPITNVYLNGKSVSIDDITSITNTTYCSFTLDTDAEFNVTPNRLIYDSNFTFTNGSRSITYTGETELTSLVQERDWIKYEGDADSKFIRVVDIVGNTINCNTNYTGTTKRSVNIDRRRPDYISDDSNVSVSCFGKTVDGTSTGVLIESGALVVKELLIDIGLTADIDTASFTQASTDNDMRMSIALPYDRDDTAPKVKEVINDINRTVFGSLSLKQDLTLAYNILSAERADTITKINEDDVIKWKVVGKNTDTYKKVYGSFKFVDYDNNKKEEGHSLVEYESDKMIDLDISNKEVDREFRVYTENDAQESAERFIFNNEQALMELKLESDLRLSSVEIGDKITVSFNRFINQPAIGDSERVFSVTGITKDSNKVVLTITDLGNIYNRAGVISSDSALDYSASTVDERRFNSYITDDNGIITGSDESNGTNLIS
jgi:adhesin HecA-like repeat protein